MWGNCGCSRIYRRYLDFHEPRNIIFCSYGLPPSAYLPTKSHADYVRNILVYKDALCDALSRQLCSPAHLNVFHPVADGDSKQYVEDSQRSNAKVCHAAFKNCWYVDDVTLRIIRRGFSRHLLPSHSHAQKVHTNTVFRTVHLISTSRLIYRELTPIVSQDN